MNKQKRRKVPKKYGFFLHCDIPIYVVVKQDKYVYALHWFDLDQTWVHDQTNISDVFSDAYTVKLSFLEWIQELRLTGVKYPRYLVSLSNKQVARLNELFSGKRMRREDIDLFNLNEIESVVDLNGLIYKEV